MPAEESLIDSAARLLQACFSRSSSISPHPAKLGQKLIAKSQERFLKDHEAETSQLNRLENSGFLIRACARIRNDIAVSCIDPSLRKLRFAQDDKAISSAPSRQYRSYSAQFLASKKLASASAQVLAES